MAWALRLSKAGYGNFQEIMEWDSESFLTVLEYDIFCSDYDEVFFELNRPKK